MKPGIIAVVLAAVVVVAGITYSFIRENDASIDEVVSAASGTNGELDVIHVDALAESPEDFQGEFTLRGVVAGKSKSEGIFAVIDSREFESCGELTCADNTIPVKFDGDLPGLKTIVVITGHLVQNEKGLMVEAKSVKVVK